MGKKAKFESIRKAALQGSVSGAGEPLATPKPLEGKNEVTGHIKASQGVWELKGTKSAISSKKYTNLYCFLCNF
jgi:hypothetical protein